MYVQFEASFDEGKKGLKFPRDNNARHEVVGRVEKDPAM